MYGGTGGRESRPQYVQNEWSVASEFLKDFTGVVRCGLLSSDQHKKPQIMNGKAEFWLVVINFNRRSFLLSLLVRF